MIRLILKQKTKSNGRRNHLTPFDLHYAIFASIEEIKNKYLVSFILRDEIFIKIRKHTYCYKMEKIANV